MARPRLDEQERRARTVGVRVTAAEAAELRELNSGAVSSPVETQAAAERVGELVAKLLAGERE